MNNCYFSTAVALNNVGVSLLEHGCYQQAMTTLQDAVSVFRLGFTVSQDDQGRCNPLEEGRATAKVQDAMKRLSNRVVNLDSSMAIVVVSSADISSAADEAFDASLSAHHAFAIRIEYFDYDKRAGQDPDAEGAMTLHNFALSYRCMSMSVRNAASSHRLSEGALKLSTAALSILETRQEATENAAQLEALLHLEVLLLNLFMQLCRGSRKHYDRLVYLRTLIYEHGSEQAYDAFVRRAAAAA
jgi:hypothetical protein